MEGIIMKQVTYLSLVAIAGVAMILASGCSPTGWAVRNVPDGSNLEPGETVTVIQRDGVKFVGEYLGRVTIPSAVYASQYGRMAQTDLEGWVLPAIGQTVQFNLAVDDAKYWTGQLVGFDIERMWAVFPTKTEPEPIYFSGIKSLSASNGSVINRMALRGLFLNGKIPLMSALTFKIGEEEVSVPISSIRELTRADGRNVSTTINTNGLQHLFP